MGDQKNWLDATPSKTAFAFGLVLGVGGSALVGFILLVSLFFSGKLPSTGLAVNSKVAQAPSPSAEPSAPSGPVDIKLSDTDHAIGPKNAKVTVVEYSDFQCPYCGRFFTGAIQPMLKDYKDKVRFIYRNFPLDQIHPQARPAAIAAECAAEQGKFWEYHDQLFAKQQTLSDSVYTEIAKGLKLDEKKFANCQKSDRPGKKIDADTQGGLGYGVQGTPTTFINGVEISGAQPYENLKAAIDAALAKK